MEEKTKLFLCMCGFGLLIIEALMFVILSFCIIFDLPINFPTGAMKILYLGMVLFLAIWSSWSLRWMSKHLKLEVRK